MNVLLCHLDGAIPNLALMRLAAHHRGLGDAVELRRCPTRASVEPRLGDSFGRVYASLIFERTRPVAEALLNVYPGALIGGTGWDLTTTLEQHGVTAGPDYSIYPGETRSIGFTQRGCRLRCEFCVVPRKEGHVREESTVFGIWRGEPWPRSLLLLDNDFFGQSAWRERVKEMREGSFKVCLTQGINARVLAEEAAQALASLDYRDADMKRRRLYTAWDSRGDEEVLFRGLRRLVTAGVRPDHLMVYMLVGYWPGETEADWLYRAARLREFGARPYPMPYVRTPLAVGFQRWVIGAYDKRVPWAEWKAAHCDPRALKSRGRVALPLFDGMEGPS